VTIALCVDSRRPPAGDRIKVIETTLKLLPVEHLRAIAAGHIRLSRAGDTPSNGGGSDPAPWIRVSARSLTAARVHSFTLLHEMGHIVDYHYGAMRTLRATHPRLYRILSATAHNGRTQFDGEKFADCYMIFVMRHVAGLAHQHPADPAAYQGAEAETRFRALMSTPAFERWAGPLAHLRTAPERR
jgi:hypothetical protein